MEDSKSLVVQGSRVVTGTWGQLVVPLLNNDCLAANECVCTLSRQSARQLESRHRKSRETLATPGVRPQNLRD